MTWSTECSFRDCCWCFCFHWICLGFSVFCLFPNETHNRFNAFVLGRMRSVYVTMRHVQVCFCVRFRVSATACASTLCWVERGHMCVWVNLYEYSKRGSERESKRINRRVKYNEARIQREQNTIMQYTGHHIIQQGELMPHYSLQSDYVLYFPAFIDLFSHKQPFCNHFQFKEIQNERFPANFAILKFAFKTIIIIVIRNHWYCPGILELNSVVAPNCKSKHVHWPYKWSKKTGISFAKMIHQTVLIWLYLCAYPKIVFIRIGLMKSTHSNCILIWWRW